MKRIPLLLVWQFGLLAGPLLFADVVTLKDGHRISGSVESGNTQELHIKVGDQSQTIDVHEVEAIQFGASSPAAPAVTPPSKAEDTATATPNNLILNDGTRVAGRWWSVDANTLNFLVNSQLQLYPRHEVLGVTFGNATLPAPPIPSTPPSTAPAPSAAATPTPPTLTRPSERSTPPSAPPAQSPATPATPPTLTRPSERSTPPSAAPATPPTLTRPPSGASNPASSRGLSQPEEIGAVYFWNGKVLIPLEVNQAVVHKGRSTEYWEMPAPQSRIRVEEATSLVFILRLPRGVPPDGYSLFPLETVNGARRTRTQSGRRGGIMTWPVDIQINDESSLLTYALIVKDLPTGEYSFSPSSSNDGYCFGVDPSTPPGK